MPGERGDMREARDVSLPGILIAKTKPIVEPCVIYNQIGTERSAVIANFVLSCENSISGPSALYV